MLISYLQKARLLLNDETFARFQDGNLRIWCNEARGQIAGEAECIRNYATLAVDNTTQQYPFSAIVLAAGTVGVAGVLNVRKITFGLDAGQARVTSREWEWFNNFVIAQPQPQAGQPKYWAQFGQGASGSLFVNLLDSPYTLSLDTVCYPLPLVTDADPEALPYQWTDAVPYYAAYLGHIYAQDADKATAMFKLYELYMHRARAAANPSLRPGQWSQGPDPFMPNRLGVSLAPSRGQAA